MKFPAIALPLWVPGVLLGLLVLSVGGNAWQLWHAGKRTGLAAGALERAQLQGKAAALDAALATAQNIGAKATEDNQALLVDLRNIAERAREARIEYVEVATKTPLPMVCGPGQGRLDAVDKILGGKP